MIKNKADLKRTLHLEFGNYFSGKANYLRAFLLRERNYYIWRYQKSLRHLEYYKNVSGGGKILRLYRALMFAMYSRSVNKQGCRLGIDAWCNSMEEGLLIYHLAGGIVVNSHARIGKNCHLHGNNCIGNNGRGSEAPLIGDNCTMGVGAKVIGAVQLGNNINIAAGAVVVKSCLEDGVILAGVPAVVIKRKENETITQMI